MSTIHRTLRRTSLPILLVLCLAALSVSYAFADEALRPLATQVIGDPDAAVTGKLAVGTATPGNKALTVVGVIDFLGAGTTHNYFTQGAGNNLQINTNVDEANTVGDPTKSQWKLVMGSSLDWFSIRRSPAGGTYNEDALFFIEGSTGRVGIATVDTNNAGVVPFTPVAQLHVQADSGRAIYGRTNATTGDNATGVLGRSDHPEGYGVVGLAPSTTGANYGVYGQSDSTSGYGVYGSAPIYGVYGHATHASALNYGVYGRADSTSGEGVYGYATSTSGPGAGVFGRSDSSTGYGMFGYATSTSGQNFGVIGRSDSDTGYGVYGQAVSTTGDIYGVLGTAASPDGTGVGGRGVVGVYGATNSAVGIGIYGTSEAGSGITYGVYGQASSPSGYGVYFSGGLAGTGTKSAIVETDDYGWRHLYAMESPQNWFEDFGESALVGGEAVISIEPIFAQTVNLDEDYHVFLTPLGDCPMYVAEKSDSSFTVRAHEGADCETSFDFRIIAPRLDYEDLRLKEAEDPEAAAAAMPEAPSAPAAQ